MLSLVYLVLAFAASVVAQTRYYDFNLTTEYNNPDGVFKSIFLINGQSPGPLITGDEGDKIVVNVTNNLYVPITIHWHGILQKDTPWADGVPGITQKVIEPGTNWVYEFHFHDQHGASWYHAHYRGYSSDGVFGPIWINPSDDVPRPYHLISNDTDFLCEIEKLEKQGKFIIADDNFKKGMDDIATTMFQYGIDPLCIQSILVNGQGRVYCQDRDTLDEFGVKFGGVNFDDMACLQDTEYVQTSESYALEAPGFSPPCVPTYSDIYTHYTNGSEWQFLTILNSGGQWNKAFSIDGHDLWVVAVDGVFVHPQKVQQILLSVASRITVLVETKKNTQKGYLMRFSAYGMPQLLEGFGYLVYGDEKPSVFETTGTRYQDIDGSLTGNYTAVWPHDTTPYGEPFEYEEADHTFHFYVNRTGIVSFSMLDGGIELEHNFEMHDPILQKIMLVDSDREHAIDYFPGLLRNNISYGDTIDLIIDNEKLVGHPIHLHGHFVHLVSYSETENFPYSSVAEALEDNYENLNVVDPPKFDISQLPAAGHLVLRVKADNPGIWLLHCHLVGHLLMGMGAVLFEAVDDIPALPEAYLY